MLYQKGNKPFGNFNCCNNETSPVLYITILFNSYIYIIDYTMKKQ